MATEKELEVISKALNDRAKALSAAAKQIVLAEDNPFTQRASLASAAERLRGLSVEVPTALAERIEKLQSECTVHIAEFWGRLTTVCETSGWRIEGSTSRRLIERGLFVELKRDVCVLEELGVTVDPFVPAVEATLRQVIPTLKPSDFDVSKFLDMLANAYDMLGGGSERPLEDIYRMCVLLRQKTAFWKCPKSGSFSPYSRPSFRAQVAAALQAGSVCSDGRELRFGTALNSSGVWEIHSPGEGRIVQVGRIAFVHRSLR